MRSTPNTRVSDFLLPDIGYAKVLGMFREVEGSYQFTVNTHHSLSTHAAATTGLVADYQ